jgi:hypothetical protein
MSRLKRSLDTLFYHGYRNIGLGTMMGSLSWRKCERRLNHVRSVPSNAEKLSIPKPYGTHAPFKPTELGAKIIIGSSFVLFNDR